MVQIIGQTDERFVEDPVRMLRVIRLAAKLKFKIEDETLASLKRNLSLLQPVSPERLYLECVKLFYNGHMPNVPGTPTTI